MEKWQERGELLKIAVPLDLNRVHLLLDLSLMLATTTSSLPLDLSPVLVPTTSSRHLGLFHLWSLEV